MNELQIILLVTKSWAKAWELVFLCPMNLIGGMVEGEGFVRLVQAFMFLKTFLETFL